jgi:hypothetical protein
LGTKKDPQTGQLIYYISRIERIPDRASVICGDAISNLRSTLDHLALQLFLVGPASSDTSLIESIYFPIGSSATDFKPGFARKIKVFGDEVIKTICVIEPYKGGKGEILWVLNKLNNIDKHRMLIAAGGRWHSVNIGAHVERRLHKMIIDEGIDFSLPEIPPLYIPSNAFTILKEGDELFRDAPDAEVNEKMNFHFHVAFDEPGIVEGKSIIETLHEGAHFVGGVLDQFVPFF